MFEPYMSKRNEIFALYAKIDGARLPAFMAVYLKAKPFMDTILTAKDYLTLKEACEPEGIFVEDGGLMAVYAGEEFIARKKEAGKKIPRPALLGIPFSPERTDALVQVFISFDQGIIENARRLGWRNLFIGDHLLQQPFLDDFFYRFSMGTPECCNRFGFGHSGSYSHENLQWKWNRISHISANTHGRYSFYCNHIPAEHTYYLIQYPPCSFNCRKTIEKAGGLLQEIRKVEPEFASKIEYHLKLPCLVFGDDQAYVLEGRPEGNAVYYSDSIFLGNQDQAQEYEEIRRGDRIVQTTDFIHVYDGEEEIARYPQKDEDDLKLLLFT